MLEFLKDHLKIEFKWYQCEILPRGHKVSVVPWSCQGTHQSLDNTILTQRGSQHQVALLAVWEETTYQTSLVWGRGKVCEHAEGNKGEMKEVKRQVRQEKFLEHDEARDLVKALRKSKETPFMSASQWALLFGSYVLSFIHISQNWSQMLWGEKGSRREREEKGEEWKKAFPVNKKSIFFPQRNALQWMHLPQPRGPSENTLHRPALTPGLCSLNSSLAKLWQGTNSVTQFIFPSIWKCRFTPPPQLVMML